MKAKTKTKALLMSLCAVLLVAASVLGTMAYLTDSKDVKNTFTVGNVAIKLDEAKVDENGTQVVDKDGNPVARVTENEYKLLPGHTYTKDPTVTVLAPSVESYVRMKVTFNKASALIAMCTDPEFAEDGPTGVENAFPLIRMVKFVEANAAKWDGIIPDNMVDTKDMLNNTKYCVYDKAADTLTFYYYYTEPVAAIDADVKLATLFDSIKVPEWATGDQLKALQGFEINVVAEAIQADGFENADAAWAAFAAQK
jgi:predicted ribosomally synthesized peptide with SipW-like signal peptide